MVSKTNKMTIIGFLIIAVSLFIDIVVMVDMTRLPIDEVFPVIKYYLIWVVVPYVVMSFFLLWHLRSTPRTVIMDCIAILLVSIAGLFFLISEQSGWIIIVVPLFQVPAFILVRFVLYSIWEDID